MKEAIWIRKTNATINEGNYEVPHIYNDVIPSLKWLYSKQPKLGLTQETSLALMKSP